MLTSLLLMLSVAAPSPKVDTTAWEKKTLASLGKRPFSFKATLTLPPKTRAQTMSLEGGAMGYLDLPNGVRVVLMERSAKAKNDPGPTAQLLAMTGKVLEVRKSASAYMIFVQQEQGLVIQGASWAVSPGLDCATEQPVTMAQAEEVTAICDSMAAIKPAGP